MEQVDQGKFSCQECGKSYKWKPEFAGRKVKCKCGYVMTAPKNPPGSAPQKDEPQDFKTVDLYLPMGLLVAGIGLSVIQYMYMQMRTLALPQALMYTAAQLVLSFILIAIVSVFLIKLMEMAFGDPGLAALKIAAVVLAPAALANMIGFWVNDLWGLVRFFVAFGMIFIVYHYLFEWDQGEKW